MEAILMALSRTVNDARHISRESFGSSTWLGCDGPAGFFPLTFPFPLLGRLHSASLLSDLNLALSGQRDGWTGVSREDCHVSPQTEVKGLTCCGCTLHHPIHWESVWKRRVN